jgi:phage shock protein PspC (stress-responsive transcriptional regulator)
MKQNRTVAGAVAGVVAATFFAAVGTVAEKTAALFIIFTLVVQTRPQQRSV